MKVLFYKVLIFVSGLTGYWFFRGMVWCVAAGYFIFFPARVQPSIAFYRALFPGKGLLYYCQCAWKQFQSFTTVFLDRWIAGKPGAISFSHEGWEHMQAAVEAGSGGILLMSHLGNWELGARHLTRIAGEPTIRLLLYLGEKQGEQIEGLQKQDLNQHGIRIIAVKPDASAPFELLEGIRFLKEGGFVSMTGDRLWSATQRAVSVNFLGQEALIPEVPFHLALIAGVPLIIFFVNRQGNHRYHCTLLPPCFVAAATPAERRGAICKAAQHYADMLEKAVRNNPFQWYHFEPFIKTIQKQ